MSEQYIPLYRKYRPQILDDLVGQEHIKNALKNAIKLDKISHAYLFTGPRGTGKTSSARILAKSLNCVEGPTDKPCGKCESCIDITNSTPVDVIEIDAASNRSVEDARNILEKIQYVPINGKYKIYIIDEVHMLTKEAFNTLLKTLEEPPKNVIFILATTEPQKVLETITSRCQRFDFRRITTEDIVNHLKKISEKEKIKIADDAIFAIAKNVSGGMRDALALLDQLSVLSKKITIDDINNILGKISFDVLNLITKEITASNSQKSIEILNETYNKGNEPVQILTNLLNHFKNMLIVKNCDNEGIILDTTQLNKKQADELKELAQQLETQQIVFLIERISYYIKEIKTTNNQQLWLEIAIIDLSNMSENSKLIDLEKRISALEGGKVEIKQSFKMNSQFTAPIKPVNKEEEKISKITEAKQQVAENAIEKPIEERKKDIVKEVELKADAVSEKEEKLESKEISIDKDSEVEKPLDKASLITLWHELLSNIGSPAQSAYLNQNAKPVNISEKGIIISCKLESFISRMNEPSRKKPIEEAAQIMFSTKKNIDVIIRLPLDSDEKISNTKLEKKKMMQPVVKPSEKEEAPENIEEFTEDLEQNSEKPLTEIQDVEFHSDQVKMVRDLFDGKYIETP